MKTVTTTTVHLEHQWGVYVDRLAMGAVVTALLQNNAHGFLIENDFGGSGSWKITFHAAYERTLIEQLLGEMVKHVGDWFEVEE